MVLESIRVVLVAENDLLEVVSEIPDSKIAQKASKTKENQRGLLSYYVYSGPLPLKVGSV